MLYANAIKILQVLFFENLTIEKMIQFAENHKQGESLMALPEPMKEVLKMPSAYISNVLYTMIGQPFKDWVNEQIEKGNAKIVEEQNLAINMHP